MTIAETIRSNSNPYRESIALFAYREYHRDEGKVTFYFEDSSSLTFIVEHVLK